MISRSLSNRFCGREAAANLFKICLKIHFLALRGKVRKSIFGLISGCSGRTQKSMIKSTLELFELLSGSMGLSLVVVCRRLSPSFCVAFRTLSSFVVVSCRFSSFSIVCHRFRRSFEKSRFLIVLRLETITISFALKNRHQRWS